MCWPLSGGGGGSPSRSGSVCTAPPRVGRDSWSTTSWPESTSSSAAARPARPPPTTATLCRRPPCAAEAGAAPCGRIVTLLSHHRCQALVMVQRDGSLWKTSHQVGGHDPELGRRREPRRAVEDVEAARLDSLERRPVEAGERAYAGRAPVVEVVQQGQTLLEVRTSAGRLVCHQRLPCGREPPGGDVLLGDAERGELVLRQIHPSQLPVLGDVPHDVDQ